MNDKTCKDCPCCEQEKEECRLNPPMGGMESGWEFPRVMAADWCYRGREIMEGKK